MHIKVLIYVLDNTNILIQSPLFISHSFTLIAKINDNPSRRLCSTVAIKNFAAVQTWVLKQTREISVSNGSFKCIVEVVIYFVARVAVCTQIYISDTFNDTLNNKLANSFSCPLYEYFNYLFK